MNLMKKCKTMETFNFVKVENEDKLAELLACRVCLETDAKLIDLHENGLTESFGEITGTLVSKTDGMPQHICLICYSLMHKCSTFRNKCWKVNTLLQDALEHQPLISTTYIKTLDRTQYKLPLTCQKAFNFQISLQNNETTGFSTTSVKLETEFKSSDEEIWDENNDENNYGFVPFHESGEEGDLEKPLILENYTNVPEKITTGSNKEEADLEKSLIQEENLENYTEIYANESEKRKTRSNKKIKNYTEIHVEPDNRITRSNKKIDNHTEIYEDEKRITRSNKRKNSLKIEKVKRKKEEKVKRPFNRKYEEDFASFSESFNCDVVFYTREQQLREVEERKESIEFKKARFKCEICFKGFMNVSAHEKHMTTHDKASGEHVCDVCFARFPVRRILMNHLRTHKNRFICKICEHSSKNSTLAKAHYKWHEGFKYECKMCNKQFNTMSTHLNHKRAYHASVTCDVCHETVSGTKGLEEHNEKVHSSAKVPCSTCRRQFDSQEAFNRHLSPGSVCVHNNSPCTKCGENFESKQLMFDHRETVHGETLFRCDECPEAYTTGRMLAAHWTFRHAKSSFMCEICARSYKTSSALKTHQRVHAGSGHKLERSSTVFDTDVYLQSNAKKNERVESADRPFQCPMCPKTFRQNSNLRVHINTHTGERPYKCNQCTAAFKSYSQKYKHSLMVHKKERRYKCHMCEKTYVVSFDLKMHIRTFHMKIPRPPVNRRKNRNKANNN